MSYNIINLKHLFLICQKKIDIEYLSIVNLFLPIEIINLSALFFIKDFLIY